jgi:hypothetical protein
MRKGCAAPTAFVSVSPAALIKAFHKVQARPRAHVKTATVVHYSRIEAELVEQANEPDDSDDPQFTHDIHSQSGCCE